MEFLILHSHFFSSVLGPPQRRYLELLPIYQPNPYPNEQDLPRTLLLAILINLDQVRQFLYWPLLHWLALELRLDLLQIPLYQSLQMPPQLQIFECRIAVSDQNPYTSYFYLSYSP